MVADAVMAVMRHPVRVTGCVLSSFVPGSARCPVRDRNTSSRLGSRTVKRSGISDSRSSVRTTSSVPRPASAMVTPSVASPIRSVLPSGASSGSARTRSSGVERDLDDRRAVVLLELGRGALGDGAAAVDHHDPVGEAVGFLEVLRREQHGRAARDELFDHAPEVGAARGVEAGRRLVEEQDRRSVHERGGEVEPAPHAAGVRLGRTVRRVGQPELLEQLVGARAGALARLVGEVADEPEVLASGEVVVDGGVLAGEPDALAHGLGIGHDVDAEHRGPARRRAGGSW